jgi:hypothetical protein
MATPQHAGAVSANRNRLRSVVGKGAMHRRAEIVERSFAHTIERGSMQRCWLRGREIVHKRYPFTLLATTSGFGILVIAAG